MKNKIYEIYEIKTYSTNPEQCTLDGCLVDGYDKDEVIKKAEDYLSDRADDNAEYGSHDDYFMLVITDVKTNIEVREQITLNWYAENDTYRDDVRFDYMSSRM